MWPPTEGEGAAFPPSVIATLKPGKPLRLAFGSCRVSVSHDEAGNKSFGVDALRSYALRMAGLTETPPTRTSAGRTWCSSSATRSTPTRPARRCRSSSPRGAPSTSRPGEELKDYEEYAHLYKLAWSDPANRWLLSTLPSAMIFDDHDIRDDWNTSWSWRRKMEATDWWHDRIVGGLGVVLGLPAPRATSGPRARAEDALWQRIASYDGDGELDITDALDELADRADQEPESYRWSFARDFDTRHA